MGNTYTLLHFPYQIHINFQNKCVDINNNNEPLNHIEMRKMACAITDIINLDDHNDEIKIAIIKIRYQTSKLATRHLNEPKDTSLHLIDQCYTHISFLKHTITSNMQNKYYSESLIKLYFKIILLKSQISRNEDKLLSEQLLIECKDIACNIQLTQELRISLTYELIDTLLYESSVIIHYQCDSNLIEAVDLLDIALDLISNQHRSIVPFDQDILKQLHIRILKALCLTHVLLHDGPNASKCLFELEKFNDDDHLIQILDILKFKVFMCLNDIENAKSTLFKCTSNEAICKSACIQAFEEIWMSEEAMMSDLTYLKHIFQDLCQRFQNDSKLPLQFYTIILNANDINDEIDKWSTETLLDLYNMDKCTDEEMRNCCYILMWNAGTIRYKNQLYTQSINYFKACLELVEDKTEKSKVARILSLNYMAIQEYIKYLINYISN